MPRKRSGGWEIYQDPSRGPDSSYIVRFWHGRDYKRSTGTSDASEAAKEAARIYAAIVSTEPERPAKRRQLGSGLTLEALVAGWATAISATLDPETVETYEGYATARWFDFFSDALHNVTSATCADFMRSRMHAVQASSVRKELSALRGFLDWCTEQGHLTREVVVPSVPKRATGTRYGKRRRSAAIPLSPDEVEAIIERLPEWCDVSRRPGMELYPVKARFEVAYETGLRPATLDALSVPEHYEKGSGFLVIPPELDKSRDGRDIPLTPRAQAALDRVCPTSGPIFGSHDYRPHLRKAAKKALPPARAKVFCGAHLRSAMMTHGLERPEGNLPAIQYMVGHKHVSTTARYVKASRRAAVEMIKKRG